MEKINGICIEGKFYEAVECNEIAPCDHCDMQWKCLISSHNVEPICSEIFGNYSIFRYSPELTEKLKGK